MTSARPRRILIDGSMARRGGGFTYLVNVVHRIARLMPEDELRLWVRHRPLYEAVPREPNLEVELLPEAGLAARLRFTGWEAPRRARRFGADLYFAAGDLAPLRAPCPVVASFRNPNVFTDLDQGWYRYQVLRLGFLRRLARLTASRVARILFVSEDSARWIGDAIGLDPARRCVIHHGIDFEAWSAPPGGALRPRPYVLSVSTIYRYKNFARLIEAWALLAARRPELPDLVIAGDDMDPLYSARMRAARAATGPLAERIELRGEIPYGELQPWYAGARAFAFPSYLETFGHPLLEALAAGVPVVAADLPVSREVAGEAALYADPRDPAALAGALERALFEPGLRDELVARGRERARAFSWDRSARDHVALFEEVIAGRISSGPQPAR